MELDRTESCWIKKNLMVEPFGSSNELQPSPHADDMQNN